MARNKPKAIRLELDDHELCMIERNDAVGKALELEYRVTFKERQDKLSRWWEETNKRISERLGIDATNYKVDRENGKLILLSPVEVEQRKKAV